MSPELKFEAIAISGFCTEHRIARLALFGSAVKGTLRPDSDVDVLVEFEPGQTPGYLGMARLARSLSNLMGGRPVDLRTPQELSPYFKAEVLAACEVQYGKP